jgi:hypothetical protein
MLGVMCNFSFEEKDYKKIKQISIQKQNKTINKQLI